ncbi:MAG: hypothetical protein IKD58_04010 [Loktanella sp.]|nr:hypothetical protein [Loktanella sp.]
MQDRYAGDVGDFVKPVLLGAISPERNLAVAWYQYPDEGHNGDGRSSNKALNVPKVPVSKLRAWRTFWFGWGLRIQRKALVFPSKGCFL